MMGITGHRMCCKGAGEQLVNRSAESCECLFPPEDYRSIGSTD
jgi:hypothetical protein